MKNILCALLIGCLISWGRAQTPDQQKQTKAKGCLFITSTPLEAEIVGTQGNYVIFKEKTPVLLCDRLTNKIQIVFTKDGFEKHLITVYPKPGQVDTLFATLKPKTSRQTYRNKWQSWFWSGVTAASAIAVVTVVLLEVDRQKDSNGIQDLPEPPDRPAQR